MDFPWLNESEYTKLHERFHPDCVVCRPRAAGGLGVCFVQDGDKGVRARFDCDPLYQGYPDRIHGGVVAMLLDAGMTHCLFHYGIVAVTGRLNISYRSKVALGEPATVRAWIASAAHSLYRMEAEVWQHDEIVATSDAKFLEASEQFASSVADQSVVR